MAARPTLTGTGWLYPADASYQSVGMTSSGRVAPPGARFVGLLVRGIQGGSSPFVQVRNGLSDTAPIVRQVAASALATINQRGSPDSCPNGIWLTVSGSPIKFEIEVLFL